MQQYHSNQYGGYDDEEGLFSSMECLKLSDASLPEAVPCRTQSGNMPVDFYKTSEPLSLSSYGTIPSATITTTLPSLTVPPNLSRLPWDTEISRTKSSSSYENALQQQQAVYNEKIHHPHTASTRHYSFDSVAKASLSTVAGPPNPNTEWSSTPTFPTVSPSQKMTSAFSHDTYESSADVTLKEFDMRRRATTTQHPSHHPTTTTSSPPPPVSLYATNAFQSSDPWDYSQFSTSSSHDETTASCGPFVSSFASQSSDQPRSSSMSVDPRVMTSPQGRGTTHNHTLETLFTNHLTRHHPSTLSPPPGYAPRSNRSSRATTAASPHSQLSSLYPETSPSVSESYFDLTTQRTHPDSCYYFGNHATELSAVDRGIGASQHHFPHGRTTTMARPRTISNMANLLSYTERTPSSCHVDPTSSTSSTARPRSESDSACTGRNGGYMMQPPPSQGTPLAYRMMPMSAPRSETHTTSASMLQLLSKNTAWYYQVEFKRYRREIFAGEPHYKIGDYVKVEADRGCDLGHIVHSSQDLETLHTLVNATEQGLQNNHGSASCHKKQSSSTTSLNGTTVATGISFGTKFITALASETELNLLRRKFEEERGILELCRIKVLERFLPMNVIDAEFQFDRHKLTFYFAADRRIDFRELVRDLFAIYKTRIWLQQLPDCFYVSQI